MKNSLLVVWGTGPPIAPRCLRLFSRQCLWCWTMWVVMSPCWHWVWSWWWTHQAHYQPRTSFPFMMIEYHLRDPPYHICSEKHWPPDGMTSDEPTNKMKYYRISSYRRNHASCQKSFPFQINIKKRYNVDHSSATNKHFRNERLGKKCPQRCKKNWSPEKVSATKSCKKSVIQVSYLLFINSPQRGNHVSGHDVNIQGVIFNCSALKVTKCQTLRKFWHFFDGFYYVIWHLEL